MKKVKFIEKKLQPIIHKPSSLPLIPMKNKVTFNENIHLNLVKPNYVYNLDFQKVKFPYNDNVNNNKKLAYTEPFRLLSDKGISVLKKLIKLNRKFAKKNDRNYNLRGLAYISQFVKDLTYCDKLINLFSELAGEPLCPHNCLMNAAHTNFGEIGSDKAVDEWHNDSSDYVFVLILSDISEMVGGDLQVVKIADAGGKIFDKLKVEGVPSHLVQTIKYPKAGYCVFMQGSKILHSVTPVKYATEERISLVNSYSRLDVFADDSTRLDTFRDSARDPEDIANYEYTRHKAWRIKGKMNYIINKINSDSDISELNQVLDESINELKLTRNNLNRLKKSDVAKYIKLKSQL